MAKLKLDLGNDGDDLTINTAYAERYDNWRRLEEIQKLKSRIGDDEYENSSSSDTSEDLAEWTADHEKDFLHTLAALKTKDPKIYSNEKLFKAKPTRYNLNSTSTELKKKHKTEKTLYLKDYERKLILERGGIIEEEEEEEAKELKKADGVPNYFENQEKLKRELKQALEFENNDSSDGLLTKKVKSQHEIKKEESTYYEWLRGQADGNNEKFKELKGLKEIWHNDESLDCEEKFLRDFLLEKRYEVDEEERISSYEDFTSVSDDDREMKKEQEFEQKYNFRFEELDKNFIKQYPRSIKESLRKNGEKRKARRMAYKERKDAEKRAKKEEIRELKALKKKEIEAKLEKLKKLAGEDISVNFDDIEGDFDPAAYDRRMEELFSKEYYDKGDEDEKKPCFSEISDISDEEELNYIQKTVPSVTPEVSNSKGTEAEKNYREKVPTARKKKRNSRFWNVIAKEKPLFDPNEKTFEEYFDEYYALDYEDIIGDTITRFKYRNVPANSFGLSGEEILNADDRQLNAWASLKKVTAYRTDREEKYDLIAYAKKARDSMKKQRILSTDFGGKKSQKLNGQLNEAQLSRFETNDTGRQTLHKEKKRRRKKMKIIVDNRKTNAFEQKGVENTDQSGRIRNKRVHRRLKTTNLKVNQGDENIGISNERLKAYGVNPKKFKNRLKWSRRLTGTYGK